MIMAKYYSIGLKPFANMIEICFGDEDTLA